MEVLDVDSLHASWARDMLAMEAAAAEVGFVWGQGWRWVGVGGWVAGPASISFAPLRMTTPEPAAPELSFTQ
jgi:hypothetical protein